MIRPPSTVSPLAATLSQTLSPPYGSLSKGSASPLAPGSWPRLLITYFRSGWAFFIPYLFFYLLYAWLKWPVNPANGGEGIVKGMSENSCWA